MSGVGGAVSRICVGETSAAVSVLTVSCGRRVCNSSSWTCVHAVFTLSVT